MAQSEDSFSESVSNMELLERARNEFNVERKIIIKNIPKMEKSETEQEVRAFMHEFPVQSVNISTNLDQAIVTLEGTGELDVAVSKLNGEELQSEPVTVSVYTTDKLLCFAQLPPDLPDYKFRELVAAHGTIEKCFLMRSEETGESKGYGFVEYSEPIEKMGPIKVKLDGAEVDGHTVHCDAVTSPAPGGLQFADLHSKCLTIDNLPLQFKESMELRKIFSEPNKPVYCQIVTKESESLGFGIIEYEEASEAETAYNRFRDHEIEGVKINLAYCIPGKSAVHMFNRIMFKYGDKVQVKKSSLLPDPVYPNPAFLNHSLFKSLVAKMPKLLVEFTEQLLHLQEGYVQSLETKTNAKPGILGPAPNIPMSPLMDVSLQLGLLAVVALDQKDKGTFTGELPESLKGVKVPTTDDSVMKTDSLLGDPMSAQANIMLMNILTSTVRPDYWTCKDDASEPKLLGKPVRWFNLVHLTSFGRLMAMSSEKTQQMGLLGTGPPKPLMDKVLKSANPLNNLLESIAGRMGGNAGNMPNMNTNMGNRQGNMPNMNTNMGNIQGNFATKSPNNMGIFGSMGNNFGNSGPTLANVFNQLRNSGTNTPQREVQRLLEGLQNRAAGNTPQSLLGPFPNAQGDMKSPSLLGELPAAKANPAANFMNAIQSLAMQKLSPDNQGNSQQILNALIGNSQGNNDLTALLRNLTSQNQNVGGAQNQNVGGSRGGSLLGKPPSLIDMPLGSQGDGMMPTAGRDNGYGGSGRSSRSGSRGYDDSGYQGYDDDNFDGYGGDYNSGAGNLGRGDNVGSMSGSGSYSGQNVQERTTPGSQTMSMNKQQSLLGAGPQYSGDNQDGSADEYQNMADQAAEYAAQSDASYRQQYQRYMSGYNSGYSSGYQDSEQNPGSGAGSYGSSSYGNSSGSGYGNSSGSGYGNLSGSGLGNSSGSGYGNSSGSGYGNSSGSGYGNSSGSGYGNSSGSGYGNSSGSGYGNSSGSGYGSLSGSGYTNSSRPGSGSGYGNSGSDNSGSGVAGYDNSGSGVGSSGSYSGYGANSSGANYGSGTTMGTGNRAKFTDNNMYGANAPSRDSLGSTGSKSSTTSLLGNYGAGKVGGNKAAYGAVGGGGSVGSRLGIMGPPLPPGIGQQGLLGTPPQGQKRGSAHMLPSPEPSPEGNYIGQHSQGLGGHYAESYVKRQKLNNLFSGYS